MTNRARVAAVAFTLVATIGIASGTAFADGLTVTMPCGCQPVKDQSVGSATTTPAASNPSGSVGNTSGAGQSHSLLIYPSGSATFSG